jgi:ATPase subunit of ABC transporter with duplicated ATPase domains
MHKLYVFDFDDTIVSTSSRIIASDGKTFSTKQFVHVKHLITLSKDAFLDLENIDCEVKPAKYFDEFRGAVHAGHHVAIVTARSNSKESMIKLINRSCNVHIGDRVKLYMCNNKKISLPGATTEERKISSIAHFISCHPTACSIGFSDDDHMNLHAVGDYFSRITFPSKRKLYDASDLVAIGGT